VNKRCDIAFRDPCARAGATLAPKFWRRLFVKGCWLSTIVTLNK
jgi:hypothetical protein